MNARIREWTKLILVTGMAQVTVQAIAFVCGILVIRLLPVHEYALYTLANTMLGTITILADGGITTGVMAEGGKVWQDKGKLGAVLATGMALRKKFAVLSLLVSLPILFYLLRKHDASWLMSTLIVLSLIPAFLSNLSGSLLSIPPKLHQDIQPLQRYQVEANFGRLTLTALTMFIFPFAAVAVLCAGMSQIWNNWRLKTLVPNYTNSSKAPDIAARKEILTIVKRSLPNRVYFCFSSQISIWILSAVGTSQSIAEIGALGRLGQALTIFTSLIGIVALPRFSRLPNDIKKIRLSTATLSLIIIAFLTPVNIIVYMFPQTVLAILGGNYSSLTKEVSLLLIGMTLGIIGSTINSISLSRGWVISPLINLPPSIAVLFLFSTYGNLSDVAEVIQLGIATSSAQLIVNILYFLLKTRGMKSYVN